MLVCKGECGCKNNCCKMQKPCGCAKKCGCGCGCGHKHAGCIREREPGCPMEAVIPSITVNDTSSLRDLCDVFVHVANINTTYYIDDKHRIMITWAGPIEQEDYDYEANPLNVRSQTVYDFKNNRAIYYNKNGEYRFIRLEEA